jgi:hypothetical protein
VVKNGQISLQVKDVSTAVTTITQLAEANGGYVRSEQIYSTQEGDQEVPEGSVTIAVRADSYDAVMGRLRAMGIKVESESSTAQDVTDQYVDLDANLRNLQASEDQLLKLMDKAQTVNDILTVQNQLTTVRGQIQQLQAQKQLLDRQIALSTIQITLHLPPTEPSDQVWQPLKTVEQAWKASLVTIRTFADVLISVVVFSSTDASGDIPCRRLRRPESERPGCRKGRQSGRRHWSCSNNRRSSEIILVVAVDGQSHPYHPAVCLFVII